MSWSSGYNVIGTRCQSLRLGSNFKLDETVACKGIQDSLGFYIPRRVLRIPGAGFQSLSLKLGFFIPDWSDILDFFLSCSCIPGSQTLGFWIPSATIYPEFRIPLHWGDRLIGSGTELSLSFDHAIQNGLEWRFCSSLLAPFLNQCFFLPPIFYAKKLP